MKEFNDLPAVQEAIRHLLTDRYGLSNSCELSLLGVSENANFLITDSQTDFEGVLRVHRRNYHRLDEIQSELQWMSAIRRDTDLGIPQPIATADGQLVTELEIGPGNSRYAAMFSRVHGRNLDISDATVDVYRELGAIHAQLHQHARAWDRPPSFRRYRWDLANMIGPRARFGYWAFHPRLGAADRAILDRAATAVTDHISEFSNQPDAIGLVHSDLHVLNLMTDGNRLWAIDFDDCGFSWYMQDIAPALASFEHGPVIDTLGEAWIDGYSQHRTLSDAERRVLPEFVMLRRLLVLGWSATHPEAPAPGITRDLIDVTMTAADAYLAAPQGASWSR